MLFSFIVYLKKKEVFEESIKKSLSWKVLKSKSTFNYVLSAQNISSLLKNDENISKRSSHLSGKYSLEAALFSIAPHFPI